MTAPRPSARSSGASTPQFAMLGLAGRRLRVGQWHRATGGVPLIVLHGIGMNMELFEPVAQAMTDRWLISLDMPGIGGSPDPVFPYTLAQMATALAALLDRLDIAVADVLGISWGGALAQQFALQHGARTRRLVLAATSAGPMMLPGNPALGAALFDPLEYTVEAALRRNLAALYNGGGSAQIPLNAATAPSPVGWACQMSAFAAWTSAPFLSLLTMPVLIMADTADHLIPIANAHVLHDGITGSRLCVTHGGGHLFMLSDPIAFAATVGKFLTV